MIKAWSDDAWDAFVFWQSYDKRIMKRVLQLLKDIERNAYDGIGKPERLTGDLSAYWSRRIDDKHRLVYRIDGDTIRIVQCGSHYQDK
ncbi:MAG: Txe/YoeB family addiction module toxin [Clostridiales Family XIII bacterium]|nr:Txe/YoeB family addiction module toxin [Clostridiales Family XIII bacterium]